jgi:hypothetical protein
LNQGRGERSGKDEKEQQQDSEGKINNQEASTIEAAVPT